VNKLKVAASFGREGGYFFFIATMYPVAKINTRMISPYSISNAPFQGQDLTAYRRRWQRLRQL